MAEISERKKKLLAAVIDEYIATAEPVGSKLLAEKAGLHVSSATIRNELAELTGLGYLEQPHTSAGRVPTAMGYRLYVNELMERHRLSMEETEQINENLRGKAKQLDQMIRDVGQLAADLTDYPALTTAARSRDTVERFDLIYVDANTFIIVLLLGSDKVRNKLVRLPFSVEQGTVVKLCTVFNANFRGLTEAEYTPERIAAAERAVNDTMGLTAAVAGFAMESLSESHSAQAVFTGGAKLLRLPEFRDPDKAHELMNFLSDAEHLNALPGAESFGSDVKVLIGPENVAEELRDSSVILAKYDAGDGMQGVIGVVGPTRMDYSKIAAKLSYIAEGLSRALATGQDSALPGFGKLMISEKPNRLPEQSEMKETAKDG
ncbi:MAG: heat-inducible transcription repressor HrcA [Oscillospiraceae bacterium]|nr:heat-inducible transcription repressor HrcA [Oscillospiraceae bacterium]